MAHNISKSGEGALKQEEVYQATGIAVASGAKGARLTALAAADVLVSLQAPSCQDCASVPTDSRGVTVGGCTTANCALIHICRGLQ